MAGARPESWCWPSSQLPVALDTRVGQCVLKWDRGWVNMPAKPMTRNLEPNTQARATWVARRSCRAGTIARPGCLVRSAEHHACARLVAQAAEAQAASRAS